MSDPVTYVSVSTSTVTRKRKWRVIHRGLPTCADRDTAIEAIELYEEAIGCKVNAIPLWDGDCGEWTHLIKRSKA